MKHLLALFVLNVVFSFHILSQTNLKVYGQQILDNKIKPTDDAITFRVLDSLFCKDLSSRNFYFKIANKIQHLSDGALSEYVSVIAGKFYLLHNVEFLKRTKQMTKDDIYQWLDYAAFDIAADTQNGLKDLPGIKVKLQSLAKQNPNASAEEKALQKKYNAYLLKEIEENIKIN